MSTGGPMGGGVITGRDGLGNPIVTYYSSGPTAPAGGWFNVWDYWQDTDAWPVLDHTPMIRRALDACRLSGNGGTVYCPAYRYQLASTYPCPTAPASLYAAALHIGSNTRLLGDGEGATTFVLGPNAPDQSAAIMNYDPTAGGDTNICFEHFTLDGNAANQSAANLDAINGIVSWKVRGWRIRHVTVHDCYGTTSGGNGPHGTGGESAGINPQECMDVLIADCTAYATAAQTATGFGVNSCTNVRLLHCTGRNQGIGQGISVYQSQNVHVANCDAYLNGYNGLNMEFCDNVGLVNCTGGGVMGAYTPAGLWYAAGASLGNTQSGLSFLSCSNVSVDNCAGTNNGGNGLQHYGAGAGQCRVRGGSFSNNGNMGIYLDASSKHLLALGQNPVATGNAAAAVATGDSVVSSMATIHGTQTAPAMPASGSGITNPFPCPMLVRINGGTLASVQIGPQDGGSGSSMVGAVAETLIFLSPNWFITPNYSAAPAWTWQAQPV